jgi:Zn-dependent protease
MATLIVIFFAIGLHEYAHCKLADAAGDPTPRYYGRVTLNLFKHFDPLGTILIVMTAMYGYGFGWGKPAPMDPRKMRNPRWDFFAAVAAGPITNFLQAAIYAAIFRFAGHLIPVGFFSELVVKGVIINLSLMYFNLIPFGPLDGHWLVGQLLHEKPRVYWYRFNRQAGTFILFGLILLSNFTPILSMILGPPIFATFKFLMGLPG